MSNNTITHEDLVTAVEAYNLYKSQRVAAKALNLSKGALIRRLDKAKAEASDGNSELLQLLEGSNNNHVEHEHFSYPQSPLEPIETTDEWFERRVTRAKRIRATSDRMKDFHVGVRDSKPYGVLHIGDPHLDDDGTDLEELAEDLTIVNKTKGMYALCVGDLTNNWVGRLTKLYEHQQDGKKDAILAVEWFINTVGKNNWLAIINGNHDMWSGAENIVNWLCRNSDIPHADWKMRFRLKHTSGEDVTLNCAHDFKGHSMYHGSHGALKEAIFGTRDDIYSCGHKHSTSYLVEKIGDEKVCHMVRVAGYKVVDEYAKVHGFRDQRIRGSALTIIQPENPPESRVVTFLDPREGSDYLTYLRSK